MSCLSGVYILKYKTNIMYSEGNRCTRPVGKSCTCTSTAKQKSVRSRNTEYCLTVGIIPPVTGVSPATSSWQKDRWRCWQNCTLKNIGSSSGILRSLQTQQGISTLIKWQSLRGVGKVHCLFWCSYLLSEPQWSYLVRRDLNR